MSIQEGTVNRLHHGKIPYLLQHAKNPVDWYPWGEEPLPGPERKTNLYFSAAAMRLAIGAM